MTEEIIIDGVNVAECHNKTPYKNDYGDVQCKCYRFEDIENNTFLFGICKQHPNCYYKQFKRLQETLKHTENGRKEKANKLKRIEEIVTHCIQGGFTDEFVQEIFDICREYEEV